MTIKRKIWLSNVLMILIPILSTSIIIIVCLNTSLGSYWHTLVSMYSDENGVQFAQSMLYNYQKELWEFDWVMCQKADGSTEICPTAEMTDMGNALSELGYRFMIIKDGEQIYSNLSDNDLVVGREIAGESMENAKTLTATKYDVSVIKNTFWHGEKVFCITAIHPEKTDGSAVNYLKKYFLRYAAVIIPDENIRHRVNRGLNTDEVAEPNAFAAIAPVAAFEYGSIWLNKLRNYLWENRMYAEDYIKTEIPDVSAVKAEATYLLWIDCRQVLGNSSELCRFLRKETGLYLSDGKEYRNGEGFLRMNLACQSEKFCIVI